MMLARPTPKPRWAVWDYALIAYIKDTANPDGIFQQTAATIAETLHAEERAIQKHLRDLVDKTYLIEVEPRHRDPLTNWWIPAVYRLNPASIGTGGLQRQTAHSPASNGTTSSVNRHMWTPASLQTLDYVPNDAGQSKGLNPSPASKVALEALYIDERNDIPFISIEKIVDSNVYGVGKSLESDVLNTQSVNSVKPKLCMGMPNGKQCLSAPMEGRTLCRLCAYGDDVVAEQKLVTAVTSSSYERGETILIDGFDKERLPLCACGCQFPVRAMIMEPDDEEQEATEFLVMKFARAECSKAARPARPKAEVGRSYPQQGFTLSWRPPACPVCNQDCEVILNDKTEMQSFKSTCGELECLATLAKVKSGERDYFDGLAEEQDAAEKELTYVG